MSTLASTLIPHLACRNAIEAVDFYQKAWGAEALSVLQSPSGHLMHACLRIHGATLFLSDEMPAHGCHGPLGLGGTPVTLHLQVSDCDAVFQRAVEAGCQVVFPMQDMFWGDRYGVLTDPFGHRWSVATQVRQLTPEEIQQAAASFTCA